MDSVVLNWISNSISADIHQVVRKCGCTGCHLWLTIENQFLGNREHRTLHLDAAFRTLVQGDLSVNEYCRKFKAMTDGLTDLGAPVDDQILILNIFRGLNQCFEHVGSIIQRYSPFLNFLNVWDDLLPEELHMDSTGPPTAPTALYTNIASSAAKPPSFTSSRPPHGATAASVATGPSITTKTAIAVMSIATTTRTTPAADSSVRMPSWPHRASTSLPPPVRATTAAAAAVPASRPGPRMEPLARRQLGPAVVDQPFQLHGAPPASYLGPGLGGGLRRDAPHHSISW
jgi:hypothetical protein